jgi:hypothetical protein
MDTEQERGSVCGQRTVRWEVDAVRGLTLSIDSLPGEETEQLKTWLEPIMEAVDADVVMSDDADAFKKMSDETGRAHQVCKNHVGRNTDIPVEETTLIKSGTDHALDAIQFSVEQALADLARLKQLIHSRQPKEQPILEQLYCAMPQRANRANADTSMSLITYEICFWIVGHCGRV